MSTMVENKYASILTDAGFTEGKDGSYTWKLPNEKTSLKKLEKTVVATIDEENPKKIKVVSTTLQIGRTQTGTFEVQHAFMLKLVLRSVQK